MGDRTWAAIDIGGDLARDRIGELARLLDEGIGAGTGEESFETRIEAAAAAGEVLSFEDWEANCGRFGVEEKLAELGISYNSRWNSGVEFPEGADYFRAGMTETRGFATSAGEVVVSRSNALRAMEMIDGGDSAEAREILTRALGEDIAALTPLRIIDP